LNRAKFAEVIDGVVSTFTRLTDREVVLVSADQMPRRPAGPFDRTLPQANAERLFGPARQMFEIDGATPQEHEC
jgi:hypothetical protein